MKTMTIHELSARAGVTRHTLRFWEKELAGVIIPLRTQGGHRRYTMDHLQLIQEIRKLKTQGLSLIQVKAALSDPLYMASLNNSALQRLDLLADRIREMVRCAIFDFIEERKPR